MTLIMIVEDNETEAIRLQKILLSVSQKISFIIYESAEKALNHIENSNRKIDLFFIDYQLEEMDGYTLAKSIRAYNKYRLTPIVFITGYRLDPLNAFQEYHCYSFIQKPYTEQIIVDTVKPLIETLNITDRQIISGSRERKVTHISTKKGDTFIYNDTIIAVEVMGKNCTIHTDDNSYTLNRITLEDVIKELDDPFIIRCHKSYALNLKKVSAVVKKQRNLWEAQFKAECSIRCFISKTYYDDVIRCYEESLL